jgi:DinB superfamily
MALPASGPVWLQGPVPGIPPLLQPVAHALVEANNDVRALLRDLTLDQVWARPGGAASVGFHVRHCLGSLDRLLTYARGEPLTGAQLQRLAGEKAMDDSAGAADLALEFDRGVEAALAQLRATAPESLLEAREVGRAKLPSNVLGLLAHAGDHTYRHVGQAITTAKIVRGLPPG